MFHVAYQANPPGVVKVAERLGQVIESKKLKNHVVAVANDMPYARTYSGYDSAE